MVTYYQNEGVNTYFVVEVDVTAMSSYETDMMYNNFIEGLIQPEFRALNGEMMIYNKVNGMKNVRDFLDDTVISTKEAVGIMAAVCSVMTETREYMLNPDSLIIDVDKVFIEDGKCRFIYVPGSKKDIRKQVKMFAEDVMRKINHSDRELVDFMYGMYDLMSGENYDVEAVNRYVCSYRTDKTKNRGVERSVTAENSVSEKLLDELFGTDSFENIADSVKDDRKDSVRDGKTGGGAGGVLVKVLMAVSVAAGIGISVYQFVVLGGIIYTRPIMVSVMCAAVFAFVYLELRKKDMLQEERYGTEKNNCEAEKNKPVGNEPANGKPINCEPVNGNPINREPVNGKPANREPANCKPANREPTGREPARRRIEDTQVLVDDAELTTILTSGDGVGCEAARPDIEVEFEGELGKERVHIGSGDKVVGRDRECSDMFVGDKSVSRRHALLYEIEGSLYIEDLDSTNGTYVNDIRLPKKKKWRIKDGDEVRIGKARYHVSIRERIAG